MLLKKHRLKKRKDFGKVSEKGKLLAVKDFLVLKAVKNNLKLARVGLVVSRKVSKKAVQRNKVKRKLREAVRGNIKKIKLGYDLIFFTKKGIEKKSFPEIKKMVEDNKYCIDIIEQSNAVVAAIKRVNQIVLENHLNTCVAKVVKNKNKKEQSKKIKEILELFKNSNK